MELIQFDADLTLNERQVSCARESFLILKKRLHDAQLTLILEPPENEPSEMDDWKAKVHELINRREKLNFPSLRSILDEQREEADTISDKLSGCKVRVAPLNRQKSQASNCTQEQVWEKMKRIELNKRLGTDCKAFGARTEGEILRTIENCTSSNSMHPTFRTLRRKSKISGPFTSTSPVPSWIGPGHYYKSEATTRIEATDNSHSTSQMAFKTVPREKGLSADSIRDSISSRNVSHSRRGNGGRTCDQPKDETSPCATHRKNLNGGQTNLTASDIGRSPHQSSDPMISLNNARICDRRGVKQRSKRDDRNDDRRNGMCSNLSSLVAALSKHVGSQSELKDYTYGALSSLQPNSEYDFSGQDAFAPQTNLPKKCISDAWDLKKKKKLSFNQPGRGDGASSGRGIQSLSIGSSAAQSDRAFPLDRVLDPPRSARSPLLHHAHRNPHKGNDSRDQDQNRQFLPRYAVHDSDNQNSGVNPATKDECHRASDGKVDYHVTSSTVVNHVGSDRGLGLTSPVKFPSMETNLGPCISQWYEDNGLHIPTRRVMAKRPVGFGSPALSPSSEMAKRLIRLDRKASTFSPSSSLKSIHNSLSPSLFSSDVNMSGILLPDGAIDRAISSKLFANTRDFDLYIEEHKSKKEVRNT